MADIIKLNHINKIYGNTIKNQVLYDINLSFEEGSFNSIIGASGSGKSTLLNIMGTLDQPTDGEVILQGKRTDIMKKNELAETRNQTIGFVFQFHYLLPEFSAIENILMPKKIMNYVATKEDIMRAEELLKLVDLADKRNSLPINMSGGEQQRVAIARALMNNPRLVLADEPTGNLDSESTDKIYDLMRTINHTFNTTFIIITHDNRIADKTDRVLEIKDGRVVTEK